MITEGQAKGHFTKIPLLLADAQAMMREGLCALLNAQADMEVIAQAGDGRAAVEAARRYAPRVAVLSCCLPRLFGAAVIGELARTRPQMRILMLSEQDERARLRESIQAGAAGFVLKRSATTELLRAVRVVADGGLFVDPALASEFATGFLSRPRPAGAARPQDSLSDRETHTLRLLAQGYSNKEIAASLTLSVKTVETYKARAMKKLRLDSRVDVIRFARDHAWLDEL